MADWQPIETAPKDGTIVLGYSPPHSEHGKGQIWRCWYSKFVTEQWKRNNPEGKEAWFAGRGYYNPTHWMPLPEPPTE